MTVTTASCPPALLPIAELIAQRTGLVFGANSSDGLARASRRVMARYALADFEQLGLRLRLDGACWSSLLDEITVGETYFFRNPEHFELVRRRILPELRRERGEQHVLQVWSAGCATGEEAYSLAMLFDGEGLRERSRVLASDIAPGALEKARAGVYRDWSLRGLDPLIRQRWLRSDDGGVRVSEPILRSVRFLQLNLAEPCYPSPVSGVWALDLIFCRNVLIYFDPETIRAVEQRLFAALAPGGWLITGPSDPVLGKYAPFEIEITEHGLCYQRPPSSARGELAEQALCLTPFASAPPAWAEAPTAVPPERSEASSAGAAVRGAWRECGAGAGLAECERTLQDEGLDAELHYLHALLLTELGRDAEALEALRRALYLDSGLAIVQFTLGSILERAGRSHAARRPYRNAYEAAAARPCDEPVAFGDGVHAGELAAAAARALARLEKH